MPKHLQAEILKIPPLRFIYGIALVFIKSLPRIAFFVGAFYLIFFVGQQLYFKYAPAENFLNYYYAKVDDTPVGTEPLMTLCRRVDYDGIKIEGFRTFISYEDNGKSTQVAEYNFEANVEKGDGNYTNIRLKKQPQREGTYRAHTEYTFYVNGQRKAGQYDTNQYKMTPTNDSINDQIDALQAQIDALKEQLKSRGVEVPETPATDTESDDTIESTPTTQSQAQTTPDTTQTADNSTSDTPPPEAPQVCTIDLLGIKLLCR